MESAISWPSAEIGMPASLEARIVSSELGADLSPS